MADAIRTDADGFIIKTLAHDVGVPMRPAPEGWRHQGPEDALDPRPTRGDYRGRLGTTEHTQIERTHGAGGVPGLATVRQNANAANIVLPDPGGPLDSADPNYDRLMWQRAGAKR